MRFDRFFLLLLLSLFPLDFVFPQHFLFIYLFLVCYTIAKNFVIDGNRGGIGTLEGPARATTKRRKSCVGPHLVRPDLFLFYFYFWVVRGAHTPAT